MQGLGMAINFFCLDDLAVSVSVSPACYSCHGVNYQQPHSPICLQ